MGGEKRQSAAALGYDVMALDSSIKILAEDGRNLQGDVGCRDPMRTREDASAGHVDQLHGSYTMTLHPRIPIMSADSLNPTSLTDDHVDSSPLPAYLARHVRLGFNSDDVAVLIKSIDSSQIPQPSSAPHLPAELLLQILEYVPVDHVLDWRCICRGFRDAIDGRILYHHLRRTELIGYLGSRHSRPLERLDDEQYNQIRLLRAHFQNIEQNSEDTSSAQRSGPIWSGTHAVFQMEREWFQLFRRIGGAAARGGDTIANADTQWLDTLDRLELRRVEEGFGTLRWCINLDHSVLDMDFPLEAGRNTFDVDIHLHKGTIRVAWKDMLFRFLKTETALRRTIEEVKLLSSHSLTC